MSKLLQSRRSIRLDFEDLSIFELVGDHYRSCGIHFENAIALEPSNPAFLQNHQSRLIMPIAGQSTIVLSFDHPVDQVNAWVTSVQATTMMAMDAANRLVEQTSFGPLTYLALNSQQVEQLPQQRLHLKGCSTPQQRSSDFTHAPQIVKVILQSSAPFTLNQLSFRIDCSNRLH